MRDPSTLVVGIGSLLRRDDAVGRVVADRIAARRYPGVRVESVTQLVPELAGAMTAVDRVVFVDAALDVDEVAAVRLEASASGTTSHHLDPAALMALTASVGGPVPEAHVVRVPVSDLGLGEGLSIEAEAASAAAVDLIAALVARPGPARDG